VRPLLAFAGGVLAKARRDGLGLRASALAYTTLLSIVPLLAVVSFFLARTLSEDDGRTVRLLAQLLPYREESIDAALDGFVGQAQSITGLGLVGFLFASLTAFLSVEETLHRVFGVEAEPSLLRRTGAFVMLVFWGPILIGATYSGLLVLSQQAAFAPLLERSNLLVQALVFLITVAGLTMLFWRASTRRVRLAHAAAGALVSTLALEALKRAFALYVVSFTAVQRVVYGGFAIALFFVLSVYISWWILLVGAEIALCLSRPDEPRPRIRLTGPDDGWRALAALLALARSDRPFADTSAATSPALAELTGAPVEDLRPMLQPLVEQGVIRPPVAADGPWRLSQPAREIPVARVINAYPPVTPPVDGEPGAALEALRRRATAAAAGETVLLTVEDLLAGRDEPAGPAPGIDDDEASRSHAVVSRGPDAVVPIDTDTIARVIVQDGRSSDDEPPGSKPR
jgi:membrane protein